MDDIYKTIILLRANHPSSSRRFIELAKRYYNTWEYDRQQGINEAIKLLGWQGASRNRIHKKISTEIDAVMRKYIGNPVQSIIRRFRIDDKAQVLCITGCSILEANELRNSGDTFLIRIDTCPPAFERYDKVLLLSEDFNLQALRVLQALTKPINEIQTQIERQPIYV